MSNSSPREAAVRAYLSALAEFESALQVLALGEQCLRDGLAPFADLAAQLDPAAPAAPSIPTSEGLWRPRDPVALQGITDVYEVPGRFTFQGDDDANLRALAGRVTAARAELTRQLTRLEQLAGAPARISAVAEAMERTELENSRAQEAELLRQFEPEAAQLRDLCKRLLEAVRATRRPDLSRLDTADALYQEYVARVGGLYGKALPVLRDAIAALSESKAAAGQCYQLADPDPPTIDDAITLMGKATGRVIVRVPMPLTVAKSAIEYVPGVYQLLGIPASAVDYFIHPTFYDTTNADRDLAALGIHCPKLADYMPHLVEFMRAHPDIESGAMV